MSDPVLIHHLGAYRGYELTVSEDRHGVFTGFARVLGEDLAGSSPVDGLAFSVSRLSLDEVSAKLRELIDEDLGPRADLDETDVDLTATLQRLRPDDR
jgi:hypothetical protein